MSRNTQEFETVVRLNAQQAKDELKIMQERLDELKRKKDTLLSGKDYDAKDLRTLNKEGSVVKPSCTPLYSCT